MTELTLKNTELRLNELLRLEGRVYDLYVLMLRTATHVHAHVRCTETSISK